MTHFDDNQPSIRMKRKKQQGNASIRMECRCVSGSELHLDLLIVSQLCFL